MITIKQYPYHLQANPVKTFMRPLGKAVKIFLYQNQNNRSVLVNCWHLTKQHFNQQPTTYQKILSSRMVIIINVLNPTHQILIIKRKLIY